MICMILCLRKWNPAFSQEITIQTVVTAND